MNKYDKIKHQETLNKIYESAQSEKERYLVELQDLIKITDKIEFLSMLAIITQFAPRNSDNPIYGSDSIYPEITEKPILHFLAGLCLNSTQNGDNLDYAQTFKILDISEKYFTFFIQSIMFENICMDKIFENQLVLISRLQKLIGDINPNLYLFQAEDILKDIFSKLDYYFEKELGFSTSDAWIFGNKIIMRCHRLFEEKIRIAIDNKFGIVIISINLNI